MELVLTKKVMDFLGIQIAQAAGSITNAPSIDKILMNVLVFLLSIAGLVAIIGLVISGILYFTAAGNPKMVIKAKHTLIFSVTGLVIIIGALVLVSQISAIFS